jgi:lysine-ketoglutarate reductase/saccharopine dehydrogenase-like protein (TIGR00300 family)
MTFKLREYITPNFAADKFIDAPNAVIMPAPKDMTAPIGYHATSIFPEYFKINDTWLLAEDTRMDCVAIYEDGEIYVREFRNINCGDAVVIGRTENCEEGIYIHSNCFKAEEENREEVFSFRQGRSRETGFSCDYDFLNELLKHEKEDGYIVWVLGPACTFDNKARKAFSKLVENGFVHALLAGNALATHDLEAGFLGTALGQDLYTQRSHFNGHYNHIDTINMVNLHGSIEKFIEEENITDGIMYSCTKCNVPYVLNGSIRDDGPLPEVHEHTYDGQDAMRAHLRKATTVIGMATTLHTIAAGNMTPTYRVLSNGDIRELYFYTVDTTEFAVNKLGDRGSLGAKGIVTNVQDFVTNLCEGLGI